MSSSEPTLSPPTTQSYSGCDHRSRTPSQDSSVVTISSLTALSSSSRSNRTAKASIESIRQSQISSTGFSWAILSPILSFSILSADLRGNVGFA